MVPCVYRLEECGHVCGLKCHVTQDPNHEKVSRWTFFTIIDVSVTVSTSIEYLGILQNAL